MASVREQARAVLALFLAPSLRSIGSPIGEAGWHLTDHLCHGQVWFHSEAAGAAASGQN